MKETELDPPVREFLRNSGFSVKSEVRGVDLLARRGEELVAVELKTSFTLKLVSQGLDRQKATPLVYLAIPRPPSLGRKSGFRDWKALCSRLGLGLLLVSDGDGPVRVQEALGPAPAKVPGSRSRKKAKLLKEWDGRGLDRNKGGSRSQALVTAYREKVLRLAARMERKGALAVADLKKEGFPAPLGRELARDYYGWFHRTAKGVYELSADGRAALAGPYAWARETEAT